MWPLVLVLGALCALAQPPEQIGLVHVLFMNHLDVGFSGGSNHPELVGFSRQVVDLYFNTYFPLALQVSEEMRAGASGDAFVYTTKSWLVSLYLDCPTGMGFRCPSAEARARFVAAINRGDITWHAYPFNTEVDSMDWSLADFALQLTHDLDDAFAQPHKQVFSQRDVPGTTRATVPLLRARGVRAMSFGVNGASAPADVPNEFVWRHVNTDTGAVEDMLVMYHPAGYGGINPSDCHMVEGFAEALCIFFKNDNDGPPTVAEVQTVYASLRRSFPNALVQASSFDRFVTTLYASGLVATLPVVTDEIADTWIHGLAADPLQSCQVRTIMRERAACVAEGQCVLDDARFYNFSRLLLKAAEHTHGGDVKRFLEAEGAEPEPTYFYWSNEEFDANRQDPKFQELEESWFEQRDWSVNFPIDALGDHPLAARLRTLLGSTCRGTRPDLSQFTPVAPGQRIRFGGWAVGFDNSTGAVNYLLSEADGRQFASDTNQLGVLRYQTFDESDFVDGFLAEYMNCAYMTECRWALFDFSKYNLSNAQPESATWTPSLVQLVWRSTASAATIVAEYAFAAAAAQRYGAPVSAFVQIDVPADARTPLRWTLTIADKRPTRIPEALWLSFEPVGSGAAPWRASKLGQLVDLGRVCVNGSAHLHAVDDGGVLGAGLRLVPLDSPLASFGPLSPFPTPLTPPDWSFGVSFNLQNNIWGTNYVMSYPFDATESSIAFRFDVSVESQTRNK